MSVRVFYTFQHKYQKRKKKGERGRKGKRQNINELKGRIAMLGKGRKGKKNGEKKAEWNWDKQKYVIRTVRKK